MFFVFFLSLQTVKYFAQNKKARLNRTRSGLYKEAFTVPGDRSAISFYPFLHFGGMKLQ